MMTEQHQMLLRKHGTLIARILVGVFFLLGGIGKLTDATGTAGYLESVGWSVAPLFFAYLSGAIEAAAGAAIIVGWKMELAAGLMFLFVLLVSFLFHGPGSWADDQMQMISFMKNMALAGGLLYMKAYGAGDGWSLGKKHPQGM